MATWNGHPLQYPAGHPVREAFVQQQKPKKNINYMESGYVFAPYVPLQVTPTIDLTSDLTLPKVQYVFDFV